jgi:hypothetical protein
MPLHDFDELGGWDGVRHFWITPMRAAADAYLV